MNDIRIDTRQLGALFDTLAMGVMVVGPDRTILAFNHAAETLTGYKAADLTGKPCHEELLQPLCGGTCQYLDTVEGQWPAGSADLTITGPDNALHGITRVVTPIYGPDQIPQGCIEIFQDRSIVKDLLERVRHDDRRLKIILDNLDIGVLTADPGGHITFFNRRAETISGYNRSDVLGKSCTVILGDSTHPAMSLFLKTIADGQARASAEGELFTKDGPPVPISANYLTLKNEEGRIVGGLATITDLTLKYQFNSAIKHRYTFYDMVGRDPAIQKIFDIVPVVAASDATVLIEGPTGTGKDVLAKVIHNASRRADAPLVKVNCAALPENLLESEMFGYVKGAFTGAEKDKPGRFQEADGGTLFLDEIGDLPLALQAKLLRVLEDREFYPLGSRKTTKVDVRIISATNQNLDQLVAARRFREDLFYRLNVMRLELPPLKARKSDIPLLITHILKRLSTTRDTRVEKISNAAMEVLLNHPYPGNVRELQNIIEHSLIVCQGPIIEKTHLPLALQDRLESPPAETQHHPTPVQPIGQKIENSEKTFLIEMLQKHNWNRGRTATALKINRTTLWRKMKKYRIS